MKCSICKQNGHNKRLCKTIITPVSKPNNELKTDTKVKVKSHVKIEANDDAHVKIEVNDDAHVKNLNNESSNVLEICQIPNNVNVIQLTKMVKEYMTSRLEFYNNTGRSPYIEDEFSEWWTQRASAGTHIGKGSVGMDVKTGTSDGIDVMCVIMNKNTSNEKSLMQKFEGDGGVNLDSLFIEKKGKEALDFYINNYYKKLSNCAKVHNLNNMYILAFITTKSSVFSVCFKINLDLIKNVSSTGFTLSEKNINTMGFINSEYGIVHLYKSKKRMELRLKKKCILHQYAVKLLDFTE
jgi:hypothetical protein